MMTMIIIVFFPFHCRTEPGDFELFASLQIPGRQAPIERSFECHYKRERAVKGDTDIAAVQSGFEIFTQKNTVIVSSVVPAVGLVVIGTIAAAYVKRKMANAAANQVMPAEGAGPA